MLFRSRSRAHAPARGFTLTEVLFSLALVALISTAGAYAYRAVFDRGNDRNSTLTLASVQLSGRQIATENGYRFPSDLYTKLSVAGTSFVDGTNPSTDASTVSVAVIAPDARQSNTSAEVIYAVLSSAGRCTILRDTTDGASGYARDNTVTAGQCTAAGAVSRSRNIVGSAASPSLIELT